MIILVLAVSTIACAWVTSSLTQSITLPTIGTVTYTSSSTILVQVSASYDDAGAWWDWAGYYWKWTLNKSHVSIGHFTATDKYYNGGLRFTNVNISQGAQIISAILKFCADQTCEGTRARWNIYGQNSDDSNEFSTIEEFSARPKTTAVVDTGFWGIWSEGEWYTTPDIAIIIQEIVNRAHWKSGSDLVILLYGHPEAGTTHEIRSYDADPSQAAVLEVTYKAME